VFIKASEARARLLESHNTTTRNLPSMTLSYRHNQVIFRHKDLWWRFDDENKNITEDVSLNTFYDVPIKEHHKQFYDDSKKNIISYLHKIMTWQLTWKVTYN
jgi:hypothetical protein